MWYKKNDFKLVTDLTFIQNSSKKTTSKFNRGYVLIFIDDSTSLVYPSIFHISSRFFATGFRSFRKFFKVWSPIENHLEEIRKIEGYTRDVESSKVTTQKKRSFLPVTSWQTPWWQPTCPSGSWKPRSKALVRTVPAAKQGHNSVLAWKMQAFALVLANSIMSIFLRFFWAYGRRLGGDEKT